MKKIFPMVLILAVFYSLGVFCQAGFREYMVYGKILDTSKKPVEGAVIILLMKDNDRRFKIKTNREGEYKLVGLVHGIYKVTVKKDGYKTLETEWNLNVPQSRMKKVEMPTLYLVPLEQYKKIMLNKSLKKKYENARKFIEDEKYEEAIKLLQEILGKRPDETNTIYLLGICYEKVGKTKEAKKLFEKVVERKPNFAPVNFKLAVIYHREGNKDNALKYYRKTVELDKTNWVAFYDAGILLFEKGETDKAIEYLKAANKINPKDAPTIEYMGMCYLKKGENAKAVEYFKRAWKLYKDNPEKQKFLDDVIKKIEKNKK